MGQPLDPGKAFFYGQFVQGADLAEAGGKDAAALDAALDGAYAVVESLLS